MKLANGIQFNDGTNLEDFKTKVDSLSGASNDSSNTDTSYVDNKINEVKVEIAGALGKEIADLSEKVNSIVIPDISGLVKTEDVDSKIANVVASLNQLIADLQAGKYASVTNTSTPN